MTAGISLISGKTGAHRAPLQLLRSGIGWLAHVLDEPFDGPPPCLIGCGSVVALRCCVIVEAVNGARINVAFVWDVGLLEFSFERRPGRGQCLIELAMMGA